MPVEFAHLFSFSDQSYYMLMSCLLILIGTISETLTQGYHFEPMSEVGFCNTCMTYEVLMVHHFDPTFCSHSCESNRRQYKCLGVCPCGRPVGASGSWLQSSLTLALGAICKDCFSVSLSVSLCFQI